MANRRSTWQIVAVVLLVLAGAAAAFTHVYNHDIFWHLASGEWMFDHGRILDVDCFSVPEDGAAAAKWINVHWLFQLAVTALYKAGGFELLSAFKGVMAGIAMLIFTLALRKHVSPAWLMATGLLTLWVMTERVRVRPEAFTLVFILICIALLEQVRRGLSAKRLWWLVPMMLAWVNMHGVYVLGLFMIWSAILGAWIDKRLGRGCHGNLATQKAILPAMAATVACLITPWPLEVVLQPFLLFTRISGQEIYFTYGISELAPGWDSLWHTPIQLSLMLLSTLAVLVSLLLDVVSRKKPASVPISHLAWLGAFICLAFMALRNVGVMAPVCGYLLAWHGSLAIKGIAGESPAAGTPGKWHKMGKPLAAVMAVVILAAIAGFATSAIYKFEGFSMCFGAGLDKTIYPVEAAKFLANLPADGDVMVDNFGDAAVFIYYFNHARAQPSRLLYMDGRTEAHTAQRFKLQHQFHTKLSESPQAAALVEPNLPSTVRYIIMAWDNTSGLEAMDSARRQGPDGIEKAYDPVYIDPTAVVFARHEWKAARGGEADNLPPLNIHDYEQPLTRQLALQGVAAPTPHWYAQNPRSIEQATGTLLATLGAPQPTAVSTEARATIDPRKSADDSIKQRINLAALRHLTAALQSGAGEPLACKVYLAIAYRQRSLENPMTPSPAVPMDVASARALYLLDSFGNLQLKDEMTQNYAAQQLKTMCEASQLDRAMTAVERFIGNLPPRERVNPPAMYLAWQTRISDALRNAQQEAQVRQLDLRPPVDRAWALTSLGQYLGLMDQATVALEQAKPDPAVTRMLGDLYLRQGRLDEARTQYGKLSHGDGKATSTDAKSSPVDDWQVAMRLALCDWAQGRLFEAMDQLKQLSQTARQPLVTYYYAMLLEEIGRPADAKAAIADTTSDDPQLARLIALLRERL